MSQEKYPESYPSHQQISGITPKLPAKYPDSYRRQWQNIWRPKSWMSKNTKTSWLPTSHDKTISVAPTSVVRTATFAGTVGVMTEQRVAQSRSYCSIPGREEIFPSTERPDRLWSPHSASCSMRTAGFTGGKTPGVWRWTLAPIYTPRLRTNGAIPLLPHNASGDSSRRLYCYYSSYRHRRLVPHGQSGWSVKLTTHTIIQHS